MKAEEYRKYIIGMVREIGSERRLKQIYTIVRRAFIHKEEETSKENPEERRLRGAIDTILDELNEEKLREAHIFLYSHFGTGGIK